MVTLEPVAPGEVGLLQHLDLANRGSIQCLMTRDLGRVHEEGFEMLGRVAGAARPHADTCTVFTSDHGNQLGAHGLMFKGPYMYEESCRIPMLMSGPGIRSGHVESTVVSNIDLPPTLLELAGLIPPPVFDGDSLLPLKSCSATPVPPPCSAHSCRRPAGSSTR